MQEQLRFLFSKEIHFTYNIAQNIHQGHTFSVEQQCGKMFQKIYFISSCLEKE